MSWQSRWSAGTLQVRYAVGQHFVTEVYPRGTYHASILSGRVAATVNDAITIDLECTGRQMAADVRASYYPQPNRMEPVRDERTVLGGLPAWVTVFRLHFTARGLTATSELVGGRAGRRGPPGGRGGLRDYPEYAYRAGLGGRGRAGLGPSRAVV